MIWGEILANLLIGILGWLFLNGVIGAEYVPPLSNCLLCLTTLRSCGPLLHLILLCLRSSIATTNHHQSHRHHCREKDNGNEIEMDDRHLHLMRQHCRHVHLDPGSHGSATKSNVSWQHVFIIWCQSLTTFSAMSTSTSTGTVSRRFSSASSMQDSTGTLFMSSTLAWSSTMACASTSP